MSNSQVSIICEIVTIYCGNISSQDDAVTMIMVVAMTMARIRLRDRDGINPQSA